MYRHILCIAATVAPLASIVSAAQVECTWIGPLDGAWSVPASWSPGDYAPNNGAGGNTYRVLIDDDSLIAASVVLDMPAIIDQLTIDPGNLLTFSDGRWLQLVQGPLANDGLIVLDSTGGLTDLVVGTPSLTVSGAGELRLNDHSNNRIRGTSYGHRLVNGPGHTIGGAGQLGINVIDLTNQGLIEASRPTSLIVDLNSAANFNTGTMQATGGGTLYLYATTLDSTGGTIRAEDGSLVDLGASTIIGGQLTTTGSGQVRAVVNTVVLQSLANIGLLSIQDDVDPIIKGTITNDGTIEMRSIGSFTQLRVGDPEVTLTGSGVLELSNNVQNRVTGTSYGYRLIHAAGHTIRGAGQLGENVIDLTNDGLIVADQPAALTVDLNGTANYNTSTMQATGGGTLYLYGTTVDNTGGVIRAEDGSFADLGVSTIIGGELTTAGSGQVRAVANNLVLQDLTNSGLLSILNDVDPIIMGTITNDGTIEMRSIGSFTQLRVGDPEVTLTGSGVLELSDNVQNRVTGTSYGHRLVHAAGHTIRGGGQLGESVIDLTNDGLIAADQSTPLTVDLNGTANFNTSMMQATEGGTLHLYGTTLDNTGGVIGAENGSFVDLGASSITGGELTTTGTGQVRVVQGNVTLQDLTTSGVLAIQNGILLSMQGTITNTGTVEMNATGGYTQLGINEPLVTLTGTGELVMSDDWHNRILGSDHGYELLHGSDHTIRGAGQLGVNVIDITNEGSIIADASAGMLVDPNEMFDNQGLIHVTGSGSMTVTIGGFQTSGLVTVDAGRLLTRTGDYVQTGGTSTISGELEVSSGAIELLGGTLRGDGRVDGEIENAAVVAPGLSAGTLTIEGAYAQDLLGTLAIELGGLIPGDDYDVLAVEGDADLAGTLEISTIDGFTPLAGQQFTILTTTGGTVAGTFDFNDCPHMYTIDYEPDAVVITVTTGPTTGDINCDGLVDVDDLLEVILQWGACPDPPAPCPADLDDSGQVDVDDLTAVILNWTV